MPVLHFYTFDLNTTCGPVDLFLHDSDHSRENQLREFRLMWPALREGGLLIADDVAESGAFSLWAQESSPKSFMFNGRFAIAIKRLPVVGALIG